MSRQSVFAARFRALFKRRRLERELDDELRFHLEMQAEDNERAGMDPHEARHAAARSFGGAEAMKETYRDRRSFHPIETLAQDLRYAVRMMRKSPAFTITAVLSLAIGIGANTAVFSFADTLLLRPLTVPHPAALFTVGVRDPFRDFLATSYPEYVDIRDQSRSFSGLFAFARSTVGIATEPGASPKPASGILVTSNFFAVAGVEPVLGRDFRPDEDRVPGRDAVAIVSHEFWTDRLAADRSVLGRTIRVNGIDFAVIGVAPPGFAVDQYMRFQFFAPLMMWPRLIETANVRPFEARDFRMLNIGARLNPGVTTAQAQTELSIIAADLERRYPDSNRNRRILIRTELQNRIAQAPPVARLLVMLAVLASAVLLVACANVAGLLTSRAPVRAREIALRLAIGAGRARVVRQLVTESLMIAMAGGVLGLAVGYAGIVLFRRIRIPTDFPLVVSFQLDRRALMVSLLVAIGSAVIFGLTPAIRATRADLTSVMKATDAAGSGWSRRWGRGLLVGGQVAVSVVLLVVAMYIYRGFQQMVVSGPGFQIDHLVMMSFDTSLLQYSEPQSQRFFERVAEQARLLPGVSSATVTRYMPMDGLPPAVAVVPEGFQFPPGRDSATHFTSMVDEAYFDTIGIPIVRGRGFRATDSAGAPRVVVVNEVFAERYWPGIDPLGKRFRVDNASGPWVEVVGVAKTAKYSFVIERPTEFVYFPFTQRPAPAMFLLVKSQGDPLALVDPLRQSVQALEANLPIFNVRTMDEQYRMRSVDVLDVVTTTIGAMGIMGLALAIVGLYGLVAYAASRRTKEIGIRMAIGARGVDVLRMVLRQGMVLALAGLALGLLASVGAARALVAVFPGGPHGDGRTDYPAFIAVAAIVLAATLVASYLPARRASRVNPLEALRYE